MFGKYLRNRKHFPCFYRVIETRVEVWEKREIAWEHEHEVRVFPRNFEFLPNFHKCFYNSIGTRKKCFLFPLLNSLLKTIKKINLLILITKYCWYFIFSNSRAIHATRAKIPVFLSCYRNTGFLSFRPINARVFKRLFYKVPWIPIKVAPYSFLKFQVIQVTFSGQIYVKCT